VTLNKNKMIREIGRRTRLKNREVQLVLETLIDVSTEELVAGGKIELENFLVLETQTIDRGENAGMLKGGDAPRYVRRVVIRVSKKLKVSLNGNLGIEKALDE
jgi:nucleoid DNA-binding protein